MHPPRRRILALCVVAVLLGHNADRLLRFFVDNGINSGSSSVPLVDTVCGSPIAVHGQLHLIAVLVGFVVLVVALRFVIVRWCVRPVRDLVAVVDRAGPQNLGYRLRAKGPAVDEVRALSDALDEMMDRIAAGYEGQRRFAANASHELRTRWQCSAR